MKLIRRLAQILGRVEVLGVILMGLFLLLSGLSHRFVYGQGHLERPILLVVALLLVAFVIYGIAVWIVIRRPQAVHMSTVLFFAILFRLVLLSSNVIQEDDLYRYVWDGQVSLQGISPYRYAPTEAGTPAASFGEAKRAGVAEGRAPSRPAFRGRPDGDRSRSAEERSSRPADIPVELAPLRDIASRHPDIAARVNHPGVPTIYPPVAQVVFALTQWAAPWSLRGVRVMSVVFDSLCVLLVIAILRQLALPLSRVLIYAWSPLVLKEFANSGHMDPIAMAMVLLSLLLLLRRRWIWAGAVLALGVAGKYYPLVLAPVIGQRVWQEGRGIFHRWAIAFVGTLVLCFAPLLGDELRAFRGLGIYAGTWELNAGFFSVVQRFLRLVAGEIAPYATRLFLSGVMLAVLVWSLRRPPDVRDDPTTYWCANGARRNAAVAFSDASRWWDDAGLIARCVSVLGVLFLLSPVQTPWYLCWMVPLLCVVPSRAWLLLSGSILCYYVGFFVEYYYAEPSRNVLWNAVKTLEYAPFVGLVLWQRRISKPARTQIAADRIADDRRFICGNLRRNLRLSAFTVWWLALGLLWPQGPSTALAESFDLSKSSVPQEEILSGGPPKDGIPALTDPDVIPGTAATSLRPEDRVLGVAIGDQARAYPIRILNWHEVVNDRLGGVSIVVTYCPLCGTGMVFHAARRGQRMRFGVSGLLYNSDVLLYDRETESLWSQLKMEAVSGPRLGERLEWLPSQYTTWQAWRTDHPQTNVLSLNTGYDRDYGRDPYTGYAASTHLMFPVRHEDQRLSPKEWVVGILLNGQPKAYPLKRLPSGRMLEDRIGEQTIHLLSDATTRSVQVTDGASQPVPVVQAYWFAWAAFYPETRLYGE